MLKSNYQFMERRASRMTKKYMVIRNGAKKKSGEVYSMACKLGQNPETGFEWLDERDKFFTDDIRPVGSIIEVEQMEVSVPATKAG